MKWIKSLVEGTCGGEILMEGSVCTRDLYRDYDGEISYERERGGGLGGRNRDKKVREREK